MSGGLKIRFHTELVKTNPLLDQLPYKSRLKELPQSGKSYFHMRIVIAAKSSEMASNWRILRNRPNCTRVKSTGIWAIWLNLRGVLFLAGTNDSGNDLCR